MGRRPVPSTRRPRRARGVRRPRPDRGRRPERARARDRQARDLGRRRADRRAGGRGAGSRRPREAPIFALTDAWAARDAARALGASETIFERESKPRRDTAARLAGALGGHLGKLRLAPAPAPRGSASEGGRREAPDASVLRGEGRPPSRGVLRERARATRSVRLAALDGALKGQSKLAPDLEVQRALVDLTAARRADRAG